MSQRHRKQGKRNASIATGDSEGVSPSKNRGEAPARRVLALAQQQSLIQKDEAAKSYLLYISFTNSHLLLVHKLHL